MITLDALAAIHVEAERQQVDAAAELRLVHTYANARQWSEARPLLHASDLFDVAASIEPDKAGTVRRTPLQRPFGTLPPQLLDAALAQMFPFGNGLSPHGLWSLEWRDEVERWVKNLLDVHPFRDGNGRTAWVMRVWLLWQWDHPEPLPDYYGEAGR
jgi:hypothetical protein